jgi:hypothetical protein
VEPSIHKISAVFEPNKFLDYLCLLINEQISLSFFLILFLALPFFLKKNRHRLFLISWYLLPYLMLSLSFQKEGRFMLSALPAIALISAAGLEEIVSSKFNYFLKHLFLALVISLGLVQFFDVSYNYGRKDKTLPFKTPIGIIHGFCYSTTEQHGWALYGPPFRKDWKINEIASSIARECRNEPQADPKILVGLMGEDEYVRQIFDFPKTLDYYLIRQRSGQSFSVMNFLPAPRHTDWSFIKKLDGMKYFVFISGAKDWPEFNDLWFVLNKFKVKVNTLSKLREDLYNIKKPYNFENAAKKLRKFLDTKEDNFLLADIIRLPDGYSAYIYARIGNIK